MKDKTKATLRGALSALWAVVWFGRWAFALLAYVLAVTPGPINWDWFVVIMP